MEKTICDQCIASTTTSTTINELGICEVTLYDTRRVIVDNKYGYVVTSLTEAGKLYEIKYVLPGIVVGEQLMETFLITLREC